MPNMKFLAQLLTLAVVAHASDMLLVPRATQTCKADNCLNNLNHNTASASAFCSTYTTQPTATIAAFATSACANSPSRVSSACTCFATPSAKPLHRVYGGPNGVNDTSYFIYDDHAINIRSDPYSPGYIYNEPYYTYYYYQCEDHCNYYGNGCLTFAFSLTPYAGFLCYLYDTPFNASQVSSDPGVAWTVVEQRYLS